MIALPESAGRVVVVGDGVVVVVVVEVVVGVVVVVDVVVVEVLGESTIAYQNEIVVS